MEKIIQTFSLVTTASKLISIFFWELNLKLRHHFKTKNESEMETYRRKIDAWKHEQVRKYEEFVIEENELSDRLVRMRRDINQKNLNLFLNLDCLK